MDISKVIEGIKEFFLEILGFLLPGIVSLILYSLMIEKQYFDTAFKIENLNFWWLLVYGYVLGYVIYGLGILRDRVWDKILSWFKGKSQVAKTEIKIASSFAYTTSKEILGKLFKNPKQSNEGITNLSVRDTRSLVMSYIPESDKKIYTFMFRSELCNHLNVLCVLASLIGLVAWSIEQSTNIILIIETSNPYPLYYALLFFLSYVLHRTRLRFLHIAYSIPFYIFIAKFRTKLPRK